MFNFTINIVEQVIAGLLVYILIRLLDKIDNHKK